MVVVHNASVRGLCCLLFEDLWFITERFVYKASMYKGLCGGGVVPPVRLDVGCVLGSVYINADGLKIVVLMGSYDGFVMIFLCFLWYGCSDVSIGDGNGQVMGVWLFAGG